jgi:hypothetical protein
MFDPLKTEVVLENVQYFSSYIAVNTLRLHYKYQTIS